MTRADGRCIRQKLDSRFRGNDKAQAPSSVMPALRRAQDRLRRASSLPVSLAKGKGNSLQYHTTGYSLFFARSGSASGRVGDPVAPRSLIGAAIKANSYTLSLARSSSHTNSSRQTPRSAKT